MRCSICIGFQGKIEVADGVGELQVAALAARLRGQQQPGRPAKVLDGGLPFPSATVRRGRPRPSRARLRGAFSASISCVARNWVKITILSRKFVEAVRAAGRPWHCRPAAPCSARAASESRTLRRQAGRVSAMRCSVPAAAWLELPRAICSDRPYASCPAVTPPRLPLPVRRPAECPANETHPHAARHRRDVVVDSRSAGKRQASSCGPAAGELQADRAARDCGP